MLVMLSTFDFNVPDITGIAVLLPLVAFLLQFFNDIQRIVDRVNDAVVVPVAGLVVGAGLEPEPNGWFGYALPDKAVHDPVGFIIIGAAELLLPPPE